jgi:hypothetical protein
MMEVIEGLETMRIVAFGAEMANVPLIRTAKDQTCPATNDGISHINECTELKKTCGDENAALDDPFKVQIQSICELASTLMLTATVILIGVASGTTAADIDWTENPSLY